MAITERKVFLQTLRNARSRVILLDRLKSSILNNTAVDLETVPFSGFNSSNLYEAIQCYIDYGELPLNGKIENFWKTYEQTLQINNSEERNMKHTDWKKITQRPLTSEEKKEYGDEIEFMWDGKTPELDEEVLVYTSKSEEVYTDIWVDFNDGIGFENTCSNVIYWMSFPKPPEIKE